MVKPRIVKQFAFALIAVYGGFNMGMVLGWSSLANDKMQKEEGLKFSKAKANWVSSILNIGCAASVLPIPLLMDNIGRRWTMLICAVGLTISWALLTAANNFPFFMCARFLTGFCGGSFCLLSPTYVGEVVEPDIRGACGTCFQFLLVIGILIEFAFGTWLKKLWLQGLVTTILTGIHIILILFLPESPLYLIAKNYDDEKIDRTFIQLRGRDYDFHSEKVAFKQQIIEAQEEKAEGVWKKFTMKHNIKAFLITLILMFAQQLSGINSVIFYSTEIFKDASISEEYTGLCTVILGLVQVFATLISVLLVDRAGRKILMAISMSVMAICLFALGIYFIVKPEKGQPSGGLTALPILSLNLYLVGFSLGAGPIPWAMIGEMLAPEIKAVVGSICTMVNWLLSFVVTLTFKPLTDAIQSYGAFWLYTAFCIFFLILILLFAIETKNKTLEEIQKDLGATT